MPAETPPDRVTTHTPPLFHHYSVTEKIWRVHSPERGENRATPVKRGRSVGKRDSERRYNPTRKFRVNQLRRVTRKYPICGSVFRSTDRNGAIAAFCSSRINSEILSLGTTRASSAPPFHS
jgi:hypothetical protein